MNPSEAPNPERRSTAALLCFCIGVGLCFLAWFMGVGTVMAAAFSGSDVAMVAGGLFAAIGLALGVVVGFVLMLVGGVWMIVQVIADQRGEPSEKRYRDVER